MVRRLGRPLTLTQSAARRTSEPMDDGLDKLMDSPPAGDPKPGLLRRALADPIVRRAAMGGAAVGALLVVAVIVSASLFGGKPEPAPARVPAPVATAAKPAPAAAPPAEAPREIVAYEPSTPADAYPALPVSRVDGAAAPSAGPVEAPPAGPAPDVQTARLPDLTAPPPTGSAAEPPRIAIIIDDMGVDQRRSARAMKLPGQVTLSFLPYARDLKEQAAKARAGGYEVMLHVAMEPESNAIDPGPNVLLTGVPEAELTAALRWNLSQLDGFVGVNNHMGSKFTRNAEGMRVVMAELKARGLFFLDSVTSRDTVGAAAAAAVGVPFARRHVFIDHKDDMPYVMNQLDKVAVLARKQGYAIAIGHPRDITLKALEAWLPKVAAEGFRLVGVSSLVHVLPAPPAAQMPKTSG